MQVAGKTRRLVFTALMAALLAVTAPFIIPMGAIPFSLAMFWVYFIGFMLPPGPAVTAVAIYIMLGIVGLPVFSGFQGGVQVVAGPTGGYLLGYIVLALVVSLAAKRTENPALRIVAAVAGTAACYGFGTLWFMITSSSSLLRALSLCVVPFAIPDLVKAVAALLLARLLVKRINLRGAAR